MSFSRWRRTHAVRVTGHEAKHWPRGSKSGIPWGFPPPAPLCRPQQPFFAPVSCSNSDCMCVWSPWKRHISLARHISLVRCFADTVRTYISRDISPHCILRRFSPPVFLRPNPKPRPWHLRFGYFIDFFAGPPEYVGPSKLKFSHNKANIHQEQYTLKHKYILLVSSDGAET